MSRPMMRIEHKRREFSDDAPKVDARASHAQHNSSSGSSALSCWPGYTKYLVLVLLCFGLLPMPATAFANASSTKPSSQPNKALSKSTKTQPSTRPASQSASQPTSQPSAATSRPAAPKGPPEASAFPRLSAPLCPHFETSLCTHWAQCWDGLGEACQQLKNAYEYEPSLTQQSQQFQQKLQQRCRDGHRVSCRRLIQQHEDGLGVPQDVNKAMQVATTSCKTSAGTCPEIDRLLQVHQIKFPKKPIGKAYQRVCEWGYGKACFHLGKQLEDQSIGDPAAQTSANRWFKKGCSLSHGPACFHLGVHLIYHEKQATDRSKAIGYISHACHAHYSQACRWLLRAFLYGDRVKPSCGMARAILHRYIIPKAPKKPSPPIECDIVPPKKQQTTDHTQKSKGSLGLWLLSEALLDHFRAQCAKKRGKACSLFGDLVAEGWQQATPTDTALTAYQASCRLAPKDGCFRLAQWHISQAPKSSKDAASARQITQWLRKSCQAGKGRACRALADRWAAEATSSWFRVASPKRQGEIQAQLVLGCQRRDGKACRLLSIQGRKARQERLAQGCRLQDDQSCYILAKQRFLGAKQAAAQPSAKALLQQAMALLKPACARYHGKSCLMLLDVQAILYPTARPHTRNALLRIACLRDHQQACLRLARRLQKKGTKATLGQSRRLLQRSCNQAKYTASCFAWGELLRTGKGGPWRPQKARYIYKKACNDGHQGACHQWSQMMLKGIGGKVQRAASLALKKTLCTQGYQPACSSWAMAIHKYRDALHLESLRPLQRMCRKGNIQACVDHQVIIKHMVAPFDPKRPKVPNSQPAQPGSRPTTPDAPNHSLLSALQIQQSRQHAEDQCLQNKDASCYLWGRINVYGWGAKASLSKAAIAYRIACQAKHHKACSGLGQLLRISQPKMATLFALGLCKVHIGWGCLSAATTLRSFWKKNFRRYNNYKRYKYRSYTRYTKSAEAFKLRLVKMMNKACALGQGQACTYLGQWHHKGTAHLALTHKSLTKAAKYYLRACQLLDGHGCWQAYKLSLQITQSESQQETNKRKRIALLRLRRSCQYGYGKACFRLAEQFQPWPDSKNQWLDALQRACRLQQAAACTQLAHAYHLGLHGLAPHCQTANKYFRDACSAGYAKACQKSIKCQPTSQPTTPPTPKPQNKPQ